jgi:ATP-dependent DNA ligase
VNFSDLLRPGDAGLYCPPGDFFIDPVRSVRANADFGMVLEIAFEGLQRSARHKSGVAMRFPRVNRIRWDKPAREADQISTLEKLLEKET